MRVLVMKKGVGSDEDKGAPTAETFEQFKAYNEQLVNAGIVLGGDGLQPSANGAQVVFTETGTSVVDGPFAESKEVITGFWIWEVRSLEEAVEWARRCPYDPRSGADQVLEIRPTL